MANTVLAKMAVQIAANTAEFNKALDKTSKDISSFSSGVKSMAIGLAAAFSVKEVLSFGIELSKIAAEAEGVESAFRKIQGSTVLLNQMRQATEGTVSDLKLMKLAVSAVNNGAPLGDLAEILNFIDRSADATGKNFEELADTIIKNIGKESTKGLNELGLNIEKIKTSSDKIGFLPSLLEEVRRKSVELGEVSSVTADSYDRQAAAIDNLKASWGALINSAGVSGFLEKVSSVFDMLSGRELTGTKEQVDKALVAYKQLFDDAKIKGNREEMMKWGLEIAKLTSSYGLMKDKAIDPVTQSITHNTGAVKKLVEEYDKLDSLTRKKFLAPLEVKPLEGSAIGTLFDPAKLTEQVNAIVSTFKVLPAEFRAVQEEMTDISGLIVGGIVDIAGAFGEAAVVGVHDFGRTFLRSLGKFAQQFGGLLISIGIGEKALKFGGPGAKIAAGVALVALGGAISALMSKPPSMSGGSAEGSGFSRPTVGNNSFNDSSQTINFKLQGYDLVAAYNMNLANNQGRKA